MIKLTRINNQEIVINAEMIEFLEKTPDTIVTLSNGKKFAVRDPLDSVVEKIVQYKRSIHTDKA